MSDAPQFPSYTFQQTDESVSVAIPVPAGTSKADISAKVFGSGTCIEANVGQKSVLQGLLWGATIEQDFLWQLEPSSSKDKDSTMTLHIPKKSPDAWPLVIKDRIPESTTAGLYSEVSTPRIDVSSLHKLAVAFEKGDNMDRDTARALACYTEAAAAGYVPSMLKLAGSYLLGDQDIDVANGLGVKKDVQRSFDYYQQAAEAGDSNAIYQVARYYQVGLIGDGPDIPASLPWFERGCAKEHPQCLFSMGLLHYKGQISSAGPNYSEAMSYWLRAYHQGMASGMYNIASLYLYGLGVAQDKNRARLCYTLAHRKDSRLTIPEELLQATPLAGPGAPSGSSASSHERAGASFSHKRTKEDSVRQSSDWAEYAVLGSVFAIAGYFLFKYSRLP
mmetsp:Transcript_20479/g.35207  ORF Transcript_20479/g.35207 Transcript_20479/m.35207 type:complete len:390 (-) Transcript_20479:675-1844(-)|eukprot:CAMPEP_0196661262 /NCGR_PEP_ID=MMETSP1086-20130531/43461_1 /TAXON_ID=77921 /ORGANISM="Cyanoptyche  gloeocystis , Strain SAG4.97" /LENGTH=389 /DNA_ID=CAMNT_0041996073 /DNA_START=51 /DNA_END=1220 /DNA_ORIENTATION=-